MERCYVFGRLFAHSKAKDSYEFAIEDILNEKLQNNEVSVTEVLNFETLSENEKENLQELGSRIIGGTNDSQTIRLFYNKNNNKYYKWISKPKCQE